MSFLGFDISIKKAEKRESINPYEAFFNGGSFVSSNVDRSSATGLSAWYRGVNIISQSVAGLPKNLFKATPAGRQHVTGHNAINLIKWQPNINQDSLSWHEYMIGSVINYGNGFSLIQRDQNQNPIGLITVHPDNVKIKVVDSKVIYNIKTGEKEGLVVGYDDMYHIKGQSFDGYVGISTLWTLRTLLGTNISAQDYNKDFYDNNTNLEGYLKYDGTLTADTKKNVQTSWRSTYGGNGKNKTALIDAGWSYNQLGMKPSDAQYIETRKFLDTQIAVALGVPPSMLGDMSKTTFNNSEQQDISFVKYTLMPFIQKFEIENRKLLTEAQKATYYWKYNANGLMRGDAESRSAFYGELNKIGVLNANEIKELEDMNPYDGGERYFIQGNNATPVDRLDDIIDGQISKGDNKKTQDGTT